MHKFLMALSIIGLLNLMGCSTRPPQPLSFEQLGQFNHYALNHNSYRLYFKAHPKLSFAMAEEIALVQAAKTTLQQGFIYFKVLDDPSHRPPQPPRQAVIYQPAPMYPPHIYGRHRGFWFDPMFDAPTQIVNIDPIEVSYSIVCFKDNQDHPQAFDARLIMQSLGAKYGLNASGLLVTPNTP